MLFTLTLININRYIRMLSCAQYYQVKCLRIEFQSVKWFLINPLFEADIKRYSSILQRSYAFNIPTKMGMREMECKTSKKKQQQQQQKHPWNERKQEK